MAVTPNPVLVWLLGVVSSPAAASAVIGDLSEELADRQAASAGPRWPSLWVNLQVLRAVALAMLDGGPRLGRSVGFVLRDAMRAIRAARLHSLFVVVVLALGITTGTITYSVVDAVVLKPLPVDHPDRLVSIPTRDQDFKARVTPEVFWRLHYELPSLEGAAAYTTLGGSQVTVGGVTDEWPVTSASANMFSILRLSPALGRLWTPAEEARGDTEVAVLGYRFWQQQLHGTTSALGASVQSGRRTYRVIGVLSQPSDADFDLTNKPIWVPIALPRSDQVQTSPFAVLARMRPGVSPLQVATDVQRLAGTPDWHPAVTPLIDKYVRSVGQWMLLALGAASLVVLIASVNVANLMLTRASNRRHELAIRSSLGASRRRVAATVLAEGLLLSSAATACALVLTIGGARVMRVVITTALGSVFRASEIAMNERVLLAGVACAAVTGLLFSIVPAWQALRVPIIGLLKDSDSTTTTGRLRWRSVFLGAEVGSVVVLLVVSWLFVTSLVNALSIDVGINRTNLVALVPRLEFRGTVDDVVSRARQVAGVADVAVATGAGLPIAGRMSGAWITTKLVRTDEPAASPLTAYEYRVTPNYFDVAGLPFRRGGIWSAETAEATHPVVLDEAAVRQLFGSDDALGREVRVSEPAGVFTVVGVVPHVYARGPEDPDPPCAYFALKPNPKRSFAHLFVRTSRSPDAVVPALVKALEPLAPNTKDRYVFTTDEAFGRIMATRRFTAGLMAAFGLIGLLVGAAGVYAVMASFVAQRTREIGVRVALGASPAHVERGVFVLAARHLAAGLGLGLPVAWWFSRGFAALLFQVTPADVSVYAGVSALLGLVGLVAAWIPARRAARIDPILSMRR